MMRQASHRTMTIYSVDRLKDSNIWESIGAVSLEATRVLKSSQENQEKQRSAI